MAYNSERTRERILRAAERLFAEHGYDGVSLRAIAAAARVQLALLSYHFGNKRDLYRAVFMSRVEPVSTERLASLRALTAAHRPPAVEEILYALGRPWVELGRRRGGLAYTRLVAREVGDPAEARRGLVGEIFDPVAREFLAALERALPGHAKSDVHWAYHYFIGALLLIMINTGRIARLSGPLCDIADRSAALDAAVRLFSQALGARRRAAGASTRATRRATENGGKRR